MVWTTTGWEEGADLDAPHHPGQLLVRFNAEVSEADRQLLHDAAGAEILWTYRYVTDLYLVRVPEAQLEPALLQYIDSALVQYAEPEYLAEFAGPSCDPCDPSDLSFPDDAHFPKLVGLHNIGQTVNGDPGIAGADIRAVDAWDQWTGSGDMAWDVPAIQQKFRNQPGLIKTRADPGPASGDPDPAPDFIIDMWDIICAIQAFYRRPYDRLFPVPPWPCP